MSRLFTGAACVLAALTVAGLAILWPHGAHSRVGIDIGVTSQKAKVLDVEDTYCPGFGGRPCQLVKMRLETGPHAGHDAQMRLGATGLVDPDVDPGDNIKVTKTPEPPPGAQPVPGGDYALYDFERGRPLVILALLFVVAVLVFARLRGALSLAGLGASLALVLFFIVPAITDGESPLAVAVVGSLAMALITIPLAHGWNAKSLAALLGSAASLLLTAGLAVVFTSATHLTGFSSEEATYLNLSGADISLEGLVLAGIVVGALGVLDDVTVSQASTVLALRGANPSMRYRELFGRAMRVGRDHVSATVNTLVLAYVGAALPILLIFSSTELGLADAVGLEIVAKEVVAMLVGSIGLIAAVPVTTALAASLALQRPPPQAADAGHAH